MDNLGLCENCPLRQNYALEELPVGKAKISTLRDLFQKGLIKLETEGQDTCSIWKFFEVVQKFDEPGYSPNKVVAMISKMIKSGWIVTGTDGEDFCQNPIPLREEFEKIIES